MKPLLLSTFLLISFFSYTQEKKKGYANIGISTFLNEDFGSYVGPSIGAAAAISDHATIGMSFDLFLLQKQRPKVVPVYFDFRFYPVPLSKNVSPYIAVQPGFLMHNQKIGTIEQRGTFSYAAMLGIHYKKSKQPGVTFGVGYSNIGFVTDAGSVKETSRYGGIKMFLAVAI